MKKRKRIVISESSSDSSEEGETEENEEELKEKIILDAYYMTELYNFVLRDEYCNKYSEFLKSRIFQSGWDIYYDNNQILTLFDSPILKKALQNFLYNCRTFIRIFGFCVYYVTKDINSWMEQYVNSNMTSLPFGFLNLPQIDIYSEVKKNEFESTLKAYPKDKELNNYFNFFVYTDDYTEDSLRTTSLVDNNNNESYYDLNIYNQKAKNEFGGGFISSNNQIFKSTIRPFSRFTTLSDKKAILLQNTHSRNNAHFISCIPQQFLIPEPLKDIPLENIAQGNLYTFDDLEDAQASKNQQYSRVLLKYAEERVNQMKHPYGVPNKNTLNSYEYIKKIYSYTDETDNLKIIPSESSKLFKSHDPRPLIDITQEQNEYDYLVSTLYKLPQNIFSIQDINKSQRVNTNSQYNYVKSIEVEIEIEQNLINQLFINVYENTFGKIEDTIQKYFKHNNIKKEKTQILFNKIKIFSNEKMLLLTQMMEKGLIKPQDFNNALEQWL